MAVGHLDGRQLSVYKQILDKPGIGFNELYPKCRGDMARKTLRTVLRELYDGGVIRLDRGRRGQFHLSPLMNGTWYKRMASQLDSQQGLRVDVERMITVYELSDEKRRGKIRRRYHEFVESLTPPKSRFDGELNEFRDPT